MERPGRAEHLALKSELPLRRLAAAIEAALSLPPFDFDAENETEWASCIVDGIEYNVSRPYEARKLSAWDSGVPEGCRVAVTLLVGAEHPRLRDEDWAAALVESVGERVAGALDTEVHHHRTWLGMGTPDMPRRRTFR